MKVVVLEFFWDGDNKEFFLDGDKRGNENEHTTGSPFSKGG